MILHKRAPPNCSNDGESRGHRFRVSRLRYIRHLADSGRVQSKKYASHARRRPILFGELAGGWGAELASHEADNNNKHTGASSLQPCRVRPSKKSEFARP